MLWIAWMQLASLMKQGVCDQSCSSNAVVRDPAPAWAPAPIWEACMLAEGRLLTVPGRGLLYGVLCASNAVPALI